MKALKLKLTKTSQSALIPGIPSIPGILYIGTLKLQNLAEIAKFG